MPLPSPHLSFGTGVLNGVPLEIRKGTTFHELEMSQGYVTSLLLLQAETST